MTRDSRSTSNHQPTAQVSHEPLERRTLLSGGASNLFARTTTADLNNDTFPDIIVAATGRGRFANATPIVLMGTGPNTYSAPVPVAVPAGAGESVAIGDVNGDQVEDLFVSGSRKASEGATNPRSPLVLQGVGNGTFGTAASLNVPRVAGASYVFSVGDFNADGLSDVVVEGGKASKQTAVIPGGRQLLLLMNNAGIPGDPQEVPVAMRQIVGMIVGGFGSTTGADLVLGGRGGGGGGKGQGLTIVRNLGAGTAATSIPIPESFNLITDAAAGDFDNDDKLDLVVASRGGANRNGGLTFLKGNNDGTFAAGGPVSAAPAGTATVDVSDFNADGIDDLLTGPAKARGRNTFVSTLQYILSTGTGFQAAQPITVATA